MNFLASLACGDGQKNACKKHTQKDLFCKVILGLYPVSSAIWMSKKVSQWAMFGLTFLPFKRNQRNFWGIQHKSLSHFWSVSSQPAATLMTPFWTPFAAVERQ